MHAKPADLAADAGFEAVFAHDIAIDRGRIQMPLELARAVVFDRAEEGAVEIAAMTGAREIVLDRALRGRVAS